MNKEQNSAKLTDVELAAKANISIHAAKKRMAAGETEDEIISVQAKKRDTKLANKDRSKAKGKVRRQKQNTRKKKTAN